MGVKVNQGDGLTLAAQISGQIGRNSTFSHATFLTGDQNLELRNHTNQRTNLILDELHVGKTTDTSIILRQHSGSLLIHQSGSSSPMQVDSTASYALTASYAYNASNASSASYATTASFAMLGDINISEPGALIAFAGPRVVRDTTGKDLPDGFQTAEFVLDHGFLDFIAPRKELKDKINLYIDLILNQDIR